MENKRQRRRAPHQAPATERSERRRAARPEGGSARTRGRNAETRVQLPTTDAPEARGEPDPADIEPDIDRDTDPEPPDRPTVHSGGPDGLAPDVDPAADDPVPDEDRPTWHQWDDDERV